MTGKKSAVTYEVTYIIKPTLDEEGADRVVASVEDFIKGQGGKVESTDKKGRRRLSYEAQKMKDGFYVSSVFSLDPQNVANLKRMMTISEDIIRSLIVVYVPEDMPNAVSGSR